MPNMQIASNSISFPLFSVFTETWGCNNDWRKLKEIAFHEMFAWQKKGFNW